MSKSMKVLIISPLILISSIYFIIGFDEDGGPDSNQFKESMDEKIQRRSKYLDSLKMNAELLKDDTIKVDQLNNIAYEYYVEDPSQSLIYSDKAYKLSNKLNYIKGIAQSFNMKGIANRTLKKFDIALNLLDSSYMYNEQINNLKGMSSVNLNKASTFSSMKNYSKSEEFNFKALEIALNINEFKTALIIYSNLGNIYQMQRENGKAIEAYQKGLELFDNYNFLEEDPKVIDIIGFFYLGLGRLYFREFRYNESIEKNLKALYYAEKSNSLNQQIDIYDLLASSYRYKADYKKALEYYNNALDICENMNNKKLYHRILGNIGNLYGDLKDYEKSIEYTKKALDVAKSENLVETYGFYYNNLSNAFHSLGKHDESIQILKEGIKQTNDDQSLGYLYGNLANSYLQKFNFDSAIYYYEIGLKKSTIANDKYNISKIKQNLGGLYYNYSITYTPEALRPKDTILIKSNKYLKEVADEFLERGEMREYMNTLKLLSDCYYHLADYQNAYFAYVRHKDIQDSIFTLENQKIISELDAKRQLEVKEKENQLLLQKNANQDLTLWNQTLELTKKKKDLQLLENQKKLQRLEFLKQQSDNKEKENLLRLAESEKALQKSQLDVVTKENQKKVSELKAQALQRNFFIGAVIVSLILFFIAFYRFREKKKLSEQLEIQKTLLEEKNREIVDSINYAATIQNAILPWSSVLGKNFKEHFVLYKPKDIVSGDSYWFQEVDGIKYLAVIDCTGHGVPGSMLTVIANSVLDDAVLSKKLTSTSSILTYMNEKVTEVLNQRLAENSIRDGMEVALIAINKDKVQFSGAGRSIYLRNGKIETLKTDKRGIAGHNDNDNYNYSSIDIEKTEDLVLYLSSDGFVDQMNENSKKFSTKRFINKLDEISELTFEKQKEILESEFNSHKGNREQIDDVTVIGVRI